jgi:hypothetical protein
MSLFKLPVFILSKLEERTLWKFTYFKVILKFYITIIIWFISRSVNTPIQGLPNQAKWFHSLGDRLYILNFWSNCFVHYRNWFFFITQLLKRQNTYGMFWRNITIIIWFISRSVNTPIQGLPNQAKSATFSHWCSWSRLLSAQKLI